MRRSLSAPPDFKTYRSLVERTGLSFGREGFGVYFVAELVTTRCDHSIVEEPLLDFGVVPRAQSPYGHAVATSCVAS